MPHPRFSWELVSDEQDKRQKAYRILVATDTALLAGGEGDMWDSGKVKSRMTNQVAYEGKPLQPHTCYYWKVCMWDENGALSDWSTNAFFLTGLFQPEDWQAQWIGEAETNPAPEERYYPHIGYYSDTASRADAGKWIIIDLEREQPIDALKLYPYHSMEYLFPLRFRIETAADRDFSQSTLIAGEQEEDIALPTGAPYTIQLPVSAMGRYLRISVTKLPAIKEGIYAFGLSEIEVLYKGENVALGKKADASDVKIEYEWGKDGIRKWTPSLLTDGYLKPTAVRGYFDNIPPSPLLRKAFPAAKKIAHAFYYTSALGLYESYINGQKVGKQVFAPEWTDYDSHVQYQVHDVGSLLREGENVLAVMLADGWYAGARWSYPSRGGYGFARKFIGQLMLHYEDGTSEVIATDSSWKYLAQGPVTEAAFFKGEIYEAKNEPAGWDAPGFDDSKWNAPSVYPAEQVNLCAQMNEPIAIIDEINPISVQAAGKHTYIFDLGQNMVGWCRLSLPYNPHQPVTLRYGEVLNEDGSLYVDNLRAAMQVDVYHPAGEQAIRYEPRFTYHGFRFVEVSGLTEPPTLDVIQGKVVASSSPVVGTFACSDKDVNKLWENIRWTQWGNLISVPTDCPQRDEREGWMADAQIFSQTAIYNLDMAGFYTKWARDMRDSQLEDGRFPDIAPHDGEWQSIFNAPGWADAGVIIPWRVYQNYNDTVILSQQYEAMKKFVDFNHKRSPSLIRESSWGNMYGDWLNGNTIVSDDYPNTGGSVPNDVFATAYFAYSTTLLAQSAKLLGKEADYACYHALAASIKEAFTNRFVSGDGTIKGNTQAGYALALELELLPVELRPKAAAHMVEAIKAYDYRISTGIHTTIWMMKQLCEYGYSDIAYRLLLSRRFPSWFYSLDQGATTIWERWDGYVAGRGFQNAGMNSFNHVAIGAVGEWMYRHILGIQPDETQPGYRHFYIKPHPGHTLEWAKGSYHAITGDIAVEWTHKEERFTLHVTVPPNTEATVVMPFDNKTYRVGSGKHTF
jgi:alpha-L-rhamnosidase